MQEVSSTKRAPPTVKDRVSTYEKAVDEEQEHNHFPANSEGLQELDISTNTKRPPLRRVRRRAPLNMVAFSESSSAPEEHTPTPVGTGKTPETEEFTESKPFDSTSLNVTPSPSVLYGDLPSAPFYDTKRYGAHHMTTKEIDDELRAIEMKREENQFNMSDFIAAQLKKYHAAATDPVSSHLKPTSNPSVSNTSSDVPKSGGNLRRNIDSSHDSGKKYSDVDFKLNLNVNSSSPVVNGNGSVSHRETDKPFDQNVTNNVLSGDALFDGVFWHLYLIYLTNPFYSEGVAKILASNFILDRDSTTINSLSCEQILGCG